MNSEASSDSENESPVHPLSNFVEELLPIVDGLKTDMKFVSEKIQNPEQNWLQTPVIPTGVLKEVWARYQISEGSSIHAVLNMIFLNAKTLDLTARMIHFSEEDAGSFNTRFMTIFELLHLVIDSVEFRAKPLV